MKRRQLIISSTLLIIGALFSALGGVWGNLATSDPPAFIRPLLPYSWYIFAGVIVLGVVVTLWQFLYQARIDNPTPAPASSPVPSTQSASPAPQSAPIQNISTSPYHSCFICYSHQDQEFAKKLYADLQKERVQCWFAQEDLKMGDEIRQTIDEAILQHAKLLVVLSEHSVESTWVSDEVEAGFEEERRNKNKPMLFPIRLDEAVMNTRRAWAAAIRRTRWIGDFREWKSDGEYQSSLARLLRDLKV